ncbi:MAG: FAD-dependent oxidoreductase, partial [Arcanobacterium sp.]|nr:FAD-dependent oxidoreductase [Arcanobacterium sp.]
FVQVPMDSDDYAEKFLAAANETGVPAEEITVAQALKEEPLLNPGIKRAFRVEDGAMDGWKIVWGAATSAQEYGAQILPYHRATKIVVRDGAIQGVNAVDEKTGEDVRIDCTFVINAAGPWAGQVAALGGAHGVDVVPGRGIMVGFNQRLVHHVINRCVYPGDGDLLVPGHPICIIGTTDQAAVKPDYLEIKDAEVQAMLDKGADMVPALREARAIHVWSGARPLLKDSRVAATDTRHMSRGMAVIDHLERDGIRGFLTIAGGKFTTYRLMAKGVVDDMCAQLGVECPCLTDKEAVPGASQQRYHQLSDRLAAREADRHEEPIVCECELVNRKMVLDMLAENPSANIDDLRRRLRIGMGPCQGTFCGSRVAGIIHEFRAKRVSSEAKTREEASSAQIASDSADVASTMLELFMSNRMGGVKPILYGQLLSEVALKNWVGSTLGLGHLPHTSDNAKRATGDMALNHPIDRDAPESAVAQGVNK